MTLRFDHPISLHFRRAGADIGGARVWAKAHYVSHEILEAWIKCDIEADSEYGATITFNSTQQYGIGEIGLAYLVYRLAPYIERRDAMMYFRNGQYGALSAQLNSALTSLEHHHMKRLSYHLTVLDGELMAILTDYVLVSNTQIISLILNAKLGVRLRKWIWTPTFASFYLRGGIVERKFHWGVRIINGETGHTALAFKSTLWSDGIDGFVYEFDLPFQVGTGYARHLPSKKLTRVLSRVKGTLEENKIAEAFEQFATVEGGLGVNQILISIPEARARQSSQERLSISFEDECSIRKPETMLDAVVTLMECGSRINKSAALTAQRTISLVIAKIMDLPTAPTGEVIIA